MKMHMTEIHEAKEITEENVIREVIANEERAFLRDFENLSPAGMVHLQIITSTISDAMADIVTDKEATDLILKHLTEAVRLAIINGSSIDDEALHAVEDIVHTYRFGGPAFSLDKLDSTMKEFVAHSELVRSAHLFEKLQKTEAFGNLADKVFRAALIVHKIPDNTCTEEVRAKTVTEYAFKCFLVLYNFFRVMDDFDKLMESPTLSETLDVALASVYGIDRNMLSTHAHDIIYKAVCDLSLTACDIIIADYDF